jgi:competence protein ComEA
MGMTRYILVAAGIVLAAIALYHPAPRSVARVAVAHHDKENSRRHRGSKFGQILAAGSQGPPQLVVYVVGAVRRSGLYRISVGARADDVVKKAGGMTAQADPAGVNLAEVLEDGEEIDVPEIGQTPFRARSARGRTRRSSRAGGRRRRTTFTGIVDLNTADAEQLGRVPDIGPAIAQRIVEVRESEGVYTSLDQLLDVAGMTESRLVRARQYLVLRE